MDVLLIKNFFKDLDVEGFIEGGAPDDEYDTEAERIYEACAGLSADEKEFDVIKAIVLLQWKESMDLDDEELEKRVPVLEEAATFIYDNL